MTPCNCGRPIEWATRADGKRIALDPNLPVYGIIKFKDRTEICRTKLAMAQHVCEEILK